MFVANELMRQKQRRYGDGSSRRLLTRAVPKVVLMSPLQLMRSLTETLSTQRSHRVWDPYARSVGAPSETGGRDFVGGNLLFDNVVQLRYKKRFRFPGQ